MSTGSDVPAPSTEFHFVPDEIILYGVRLNPDRNGAADGSGFINVLDNPPFATERGARLGTLALRLTLFRGTTELDNNEVAIAAIYGYAFEGHCYRFDKPRVFLFEYPTGRDEDEGLRDEPAQGCGFEDFTPPYRMWRIRAKTDLLELNTTVDEARTIVLENNLPGRRAPNTYDGNMRLAHRGGRLTNGGQGS